MKGVAMEDQAAARNEAMGLLAAALNEAMRLLADIDEHLSDEPDPQDGGSQDVQELRSRIKRFLRDD